MSFTNIFSIFGLRPKVKSFSISTLPGFNQIPDKIDFIGTPTLIEVLLSVEVDAYLAIGTNAADGLINIASDATRRKLKAGVAFSVFRDKGKNLYIRAVSGGDATGALQKTEYKD